MDWTFMDNYPEYCLSLAVKERIEQVYRQIRDGHADALEGVRILLNARPGAATTLKGLVFVLEASLEQILVQLPESQMLRKVLAELMRRPKDHWLRSREGLLEIVYMSKPGMARKHFTFLLSIQDAFPLMRQAELGDRIAIRTLLNLLPRRALTAGLAEHFLAHPHRRSFLLELVDSFQDLEWLSDWSPRWEANFGHAPAVRQRVLLELSLSARCDYHTLNIQNTA